MDANQNLDVTQLLVIQRMALLHHRPRNRPNLSEFFSEQPPGKDAITARGFAQVPWKWLKRRAQSFAYQAISNGVNRHFGIVGQAQLFQHTGAVHADCFGAEGQLFSDV